MVAQTRQIFLERRVHRPIHNVEDKAQQQRDALLEMINADGDIDTNSDEFENIVAVVRAARA